MEHESDSFTNGNWYTRYSYQRFGTRPGGLENKRTSGDHQNYNIFLDRPEYWEESWRVEENCCHSNSSEKQSADADVKNSIE